jgi:hypothetical protein
MHTGSTDRRPFTGRHGAAIVSRNAHPALYDTLGRIYRLGVRAKF